MKPQRLQKQFFVHNPPLAWAAAINSLQSTISKKNIGLQCVHAHFHKSEDKKFDTASPAFVSWQHDAILPFGNFKCWCY